MLCFMQWLAESRLSLSPAITMGGSVVFSAIALGMELRGKPKPRLSQGLFGVAALGVGYTLLVAGWEYRAYMPESIRIESIGWLSLIVTTLLLLWIYRVQLRLQLLRKCLAIGLAKISVVIDSESAQSLVMKQSKHQTGWHPYWEEMNLFTPRDACYLWCGKDPGNGDVEEGTSENAALEMFREHVQEGRFQLLDHFRSNFDIIDLRISRSVWSPYANTFKGNSKSKFDFTPRDSGDSLLVRMGIKRPAKP